MGLCNLMLDFCNPASHHNHAEGYEGYNDRSRSATPPPQRKKRGKKKSRGGSLHKEKRIMVDMEGAF